MSKKLNFAKAVKQSENNRIITKDLALLTKLSNILIRTQKRKGEHTHQYLLHLPINTTKEQVCQYIQIDKGDKYWETKEDGLTRWKVATNDKVTVRLLVVFLDGYCGKLHKLTLRPGKGFVEFDWKKSRLDIHTALNEEGLEVISSTIEKSTLKVITFNKIESDKFFVPFWWEEIQILTYENVTPSTTDQVPSSIPVSSTTLTKTTTTTTITTTSSNNTQNLDGEPSQVSISGTGNSNQDNLEMDTDSSKYDNHYDGIESEYPPLGAAVPTPKLHADTHYVDQPKPNSSAPAESVVDQEEDKLLNEVNTTPTPSPQQSPISSPRVSSTPTLAITTAIVTQENKEEAGKIATDIETIELDADETGEVQDQQKESTTSSSEADKAATFTIGKKAVKKNNGKGAASGKVTPANSMDQFLEKKSGPTTLADYAENAKSKKERDTFREAMKEAARVERQAKEDEKKAKQLATKQARDLRKKEEKEKENKEWNDTLDTMYKIDNNLITSKKKRKHNANSPNKSSQSSPVQLQPSTSPSLATAKKKIKENDEEDDDEDEELNKSIYQTPGKETNHKMDSAEAVAIVEGLTSKLPKTLQQVIPLVSLMASSLNN